MNGGGLATNFGFECLGNVCVKRAQGSAISGPKGLASGFD